MQVTHRNQKRKLTIFTALAGLLAFLLGVGAVHLSNDAHATAGVGFSVIVPDTPVLQMIIYDVTNDAVIESGGSTSMTVTPQMATAGFNTTALNVQVGTSSPAGYNLKMYADNSAAGEIAGTDLVSGSNTIATLGAGSFVCNATTNAASATECTFPVNHWGYRLTTDEADTYGAVPAEAEPAELVNYTAGATNGETTELVFASRVSAQQPAGTYSTVLNFIATANPVAISDISQIQYLQDFANLTLDEYENVVSSMETGTAYEKADSRDSKTYNIAKLADGNIWFLDNLRLDPNVTTLTSANTNVTSTPSVTFINKTSGWTTPDAYTQAWYNLDSETSAQSYGSGSNYVGGYYNYCVASAGSYCMDDSGSGSGNAQQDLCPAGWRMPAGGYSGEYETLYNRYGTYATFKEALHASLSGEFWSAAANAQGGRGYFWSSTSIGVSMYSLYLNGSTVYPTDIENRYGGHSIRCIVKAGTEMQNLSASTVARKLANVNDAATLVDTRDYQPYSVAKLADNKIWMTKNLNLPGGTVLSANDTNVSSDYIDNFSTSNNLTKVDNTLVLPASSTSGFNNNSYSYVYNSNSTTCSSSSPCYSYYSWDAATLGSGRNIVTNNTDTEYSICPKGWKLPNTHSGADSDTVFRALIIAYGGSDMTQTYNASTTPTGATLYGLIGPNTIANFSLAGNYNGGAFNNGGAIGSYWTSTSSYSTTAYDVYLTSTNVTAVSGSADYNGYAVRCIIAN